MKEPYRKGVAKHPDLDPCEGVAKQSTHLKHWGEAHVGWVSRSCELQERQIQGAVGVRLAGRQQSARENASAPQPCGVIDPTHALKLHAREPRGPSVVRPQSAGTVSESDER